MRGQILAMIFTLLCTWAGVREVTKPSPEISMPLKEENINTPVQIVEELGKDIESKIKSTGQQVDDLDRETENYPSESHILVEGSEIKSTEQQVDYLDRGRENDPPEIHVIEEETAKTTETHGEIPWVFKILYPWLGKKKVSQEAPDTHILVEESKTESTGQQVDDLDRETENYPSESHILVEGSEITSTDQQVDDLDRGRENDPPEIQKPVKPLPIKSTEQEVDDLVKETANDPPESSSWFSLLATSAYWCKITLLISIIFLKYILRRNDLASILGQYLIFLNLIEVIYELLANFNFLWSSEEVALENEGPPLLTSTGEEYFWSELFQGFLVMKLMLLAQLLLFVALLVLFILLFKSINQSFPPSNDNMTPPSGHRSPTTSSDSTSSSGDSTSLSDYFTQPTMAEIRKGLTNNTVRQGHTSASLIKPLISQKVRHRKTPPLRPKILLSSARGGIDGYTETPPLRPKILPSSARGGIDGYTETPPLKPKKQSYVTCQCPSDNITPPMSDDIISSSSASPQINPRRKNSTLRRLDSIWSRLKPRKNRDITAPSDNITPQSDNITLSRPIVTPPRGPKPVNIQDTPPSPMSKDMIPPSGVRVGFDSFIQNLKRRCHVAHQVPSDNITPSTSDHLTPSTSDHITPSTSDHITPSTSDHITPSTSDHITPSMSDHITPSTSASPRTNKSRKDSTLRHLDFILSLLKPRKTHDHAE